MFTIELIRGRDWREPAETIDRRECETDSLAAAAAEARFWLSEIQKTAPARGATHYRVIGDGDTVIGGPP